jgi:hypothetical protein
MTFQKHLKQAIKPALKAGFFIKPLVWQILKLNQPFCMFLSKTTPFAIFVDKTHVLL